MLKEEFPYYKPGIDPKEIAIPPFVFFELGGEGRPDDPIFAEIIATLYHLSYTVRMAPRSGLVLPGYHEYTVYPLEGIWDLDEASRQLIEPGQFGVEDKGMLIYRLMMRQPDFVNEESFADILELARRRKPQPLLDDVKFIRLEEGLCVQMTHIGTYDSEPASFVRMQEYCLNHHLRRRDHAHREIYMSDPRRTAPDSMRTVLRWTVEQDDPGAPEA